MGLSCLNRGTLLIAGGLRILAYLDIELYYSYFAKWRHGAEDSMEVISKIKNKRVKSDNEIRTCGGLQRKEA